MLSDADDVGGLTRHGVTFVSFLREKHPPSHPDDLVAAMLSVA